MNVLSSNTPISNFINTVLTEKNKQIKENILLGNINFPKILFFSQDICQIKLQSTSHLQFLENLYRQKQLNEVIEAKSILEKKVNLVDNQLLSIKNKSSKIKEKYNLNLNSGVKNSHRLSSEKNTKTKGIPKSLTKILSSNENIKSLPTLMKDIGKNKKVQTAELKLIQIKSYKSKSKINNHETEENLTKNAKAFVQRLNNDKKNALAIINKKHKKFTLKLKNDIEKYEREKKLRYDEYNKNYNLYNYNNQNNYSRFESKMYKKEDNKYSPNNSSIKSSNKKYYHYSPYNHKNPKMLKNISKDLLNFNSELYYNNNVPDIVQYQYLLMPLYNKNNLINKGSGQTPMIDIEAMDNVRNNGQEIVDMTNAEIMANNISKINNYSNESNIESNIIDNSFNKKHLYFFNEPKYEVTSGDSQIDKSLPKIKNK